MKVLSVSPTPSTESLDVACGVLANGGLVVFPTETCYGIGADATSKKAIDALLSYKGGRKNKPISVMVASRRGAESLVKINETAEHLYDHFLPGPVTVISKSLGLVDARIVNEHGGLGVRIPDHPVALSLAKAYGKPITATSANTSGKKPPYSLSDFRRYTSSTKLSMVGGFLDAGTLTTRSPSTVVDTTSGRPTIERAGPIDFSTELMFQSNNEVETQDVGRRIVEKYLENLSTTGLFLALQGELGAGKTQLVKGVAQGLGIDVTVASPTYQIMKEYNYECGKVSGKLIHVDTWRLDSLEEFNALYVEKLLTPDTLVVVEWMDAMKQWLWHTPLSCPVVVVSIEGAGDEMRRILIGVYE